MLRGHDPYLQSLLSASALRRLSYAGVLIGLLAIGVVWAVSIP